VSYEFRLESLLSSQEFPYQRLTKLLYSILR
jgi:hypothetical protein